MHIVTCGDSWSKGEWCSLDKSGISHGGINQYITDDGHNVVNLHGFSNKLAILKLEKYLAHSSPDIIFYFFTDPFRNLCDPFDTGNFIDIKKRLTSIESFKELHNKLLKKTLKKLDSFERKIYVLGGCQKLQKEKFRNIEILVESISELVDPNYKHPNFWDSGWSHFINFEKLDKEFFYFIEEQHKLQWKMETDDYAEFFRPDGFHPNRKGHLKLYNFIKENIIEFK